MEIVVSHRGPDGVPLYLTATLEDSALLRGILADGMAEGIFRRLRMETAVELVEAILDVPTTRLPRDLDADLEELMPEVVEAVMRTLVRPGQRDGR